MKRVVLGYLFLIQESGKRGSVWGSDDVYECPFLGRRSSLAMIPPVSALGKAAAQIQNTRGGERPQSGRWDNCDERRESLSRPVSANERLLWRKLTLGIRFLSGSFLEVFTISFSTI